MRLLFILCALLSYNCNVTAKNHRYKPCKKSDSIETVEASAEEIKHREHDEFCEQKTPESLEEDLIEDDEYDTALENHGPLGTICSDLAHYCSYFARHMIQDEQRAQDRASLLLFCNVMELMADLADADVTPIRAETYACDIIRVFGALREAFCSDPSLQAKADQFPFMQKLFLMHKKSEDDSDLAIEFEIYIHNMLRSKQSAQPLVRQLFHELNAYTQEKAHELLTIFHHDSLELINISMAPPRRTPHHLEEEGLPESRRTHLRHMSWLCRHASGACQDLSQVLQMSPMLLQARPLMKQMQSMLSAMSLTYEHLGTKGTPVRGHTTSELAEHFATMIHLMPDVTTTKRSAHTAYLDRCAQLATPQDKKRFVEEAFTAHTTRQALLAEFFPVFEQAVDSNLNLFSDSLSHFTYKTLQERYWPDNLYKG